MSETELHEAARAGDLNLCRSLVEQGCDVNAKNEYGLTPLHLAAIHDHKEVCQLLIENGTSVNEMDWQGWTPLHCASCNGNKNVCQLLIEYGADINFRTFCGKSSLHLATEWSDCTPILELLLNQPNIDTSIVNCDGNTAEDWARSKHRLVFKRKRMEVMDSIPTGIPEELVRLIGTYM